MKQWYRSNRYIRQLRLQLHRVIGAYSLSVLLVGVGLVLPWPLKFLIDNVLVGRGDVPLLQALSGQQQVAALAAVMLLLGLLNALVLSAERVVHARMREQFDFGMRDEILQCLHAMNRFNRQAQRSGELAMRLTSDTQHVSRLFCKTLPIIFKHTVTVLFTLLSIFLIDLWLGAMALLMALVLAVVVTRYGPAVSAAARNKRQLEGEVSALSQETIQGLEHVQSMGLEASNRSRYLERAGASLEAGVDEVRVAVHMERATQIVAAIALAIIAGVGGTLVLNDQLTLGTLTVCMAYITALLKPIEKINELAMTVTRALVRMERLESVFRMDVHDDAPVQTVAPAPAAIHAIECRALTYRYPDASESCVLDFNHRFVRGEATVIVGRSGSGKSTLIRLLLQFLKPTAGVVEVNGEPCERFNKVELRSQFAVVLQDPHLFAGTIRDVLTELVPGALDSELYQVLEDVRLGSLLANLADGLDSPVDEFGSQLSGGQRARLLLARALLSDRSVLILDEPFANIDEESKGIITERLREYKQRCILIVITHENSLLELADHVLESDSWQSHLQLESRCV